MDALIHRLKKSTTCEGQLTKPGAVYTTGKMGPSKFELTGMQGKVSSVHFEFFQIREKLLIANHIMGVVLFGFS